MMLRNGAAPDIICIKLFHFLDVAVRGHIKTDLEI